MMKPSKPTKPTVVESQYRARSISVDEIGDVSHSTDVPDPHDHSAMILKPQQQPHPTTTTTNTNSDSRHSSHSLADFLMATGDMGNVTTTTTTTTTTNTTKPKRTNRRKISKDQRSQTSTTNSNPAENETHNLNNIDPLMGSMEFEESQASFEIDENVMLPGESSNNNHNNNIENVGHRDTISMSSDSSDTSSSSSSDGSQSSDYTNSIEKRRARSRKNELTVGQKETMALRRTRSTFIAFVVAIAILGAIVISAITVQKEVVTFEHDFKSIGEGIVSHIQQHLHIQFQSLDTLANDIVMLTEQDGSNSSEWPFITIPESASILERYMALLHTPMLCIYPIVHAPQRSQWEQYANEAQGWIDKDLQNTLVALDSVNITKTKAGKDSRNRLVLESPSSNVFQISSVNDEKSIPQYIHSSNNIPLVPNATGTYAVWWQYAPILSDRSIINFNAMTPTIQAIVSSPEQPFTTMSPVQYYKPKKKKKKLSNDYATDNDDDGINATTVVAPSDSDADDIIDMILQKQSTDGTYHSGEPFTYIYYPILNQTNDGRSIVAVLATTIEWASYLQHAVTKGRGIICVIHQQQNRNAIDRDEEQDVYFTFTADAEQDEIAFLGFEDLHDPKFDHLVVSFNLTLENDDSADQYTGLVYNDDIILYTLHIYPTEETKESYISKTSVIVATGIILCFVLTLMVFCYYDSMVTKRQKIVMQNAYTTYNIVSSLFPATVRDRMIQDSAIQNQNDSSTALGRSSSHLQQLLLQKDSNHSNNTKFDPSTAIADFYPSATVLFSDICGFTAWCAEREPSQVFVLLESIYSAFDTIAKKRKVFKVETIGDCYMAVVGLPEPRADHAVVMCRFARQCLSKLGGILNELEVVLGPGTADLNMRFGLHSGPVTAGVLRVSQNARFQLFGDTVNTAARMESNSTPGMIHLSQETANELSAQGKNGWFYPRSEKISAKGKGELQTYWLDLSVSSIDDRMSLSTSSIHSSLSLQQGNGGQDNRLKRKIGRQEVVLADMKVCRLVDWILDTLNPLLCRIVSRRTFIESQQGRSSIAGASGSNSFQAICGPNILEDIIAVGPPTFDEKIDPNSSMTYDEQPLDTSVSEQLHDFVHLIASRYQNENPYHNFEHAAHTIMTIVSLISRISNALTSWFISREDSAEGNETPDEQVSRLNYMRNIFDDPITSFACVLAGLVHDVDHNGEPKKALSASSSLTSVGHQQQVSTEQNSMQVTWSLLLRSEFKLLRQAMFGSSTDGHDSDLSRFRYVFVRAILATDINTEHNRNEVQYDPNHSASQSLMYQEQPKTHQSEMIDALLRPSLGIMDKAMTVIEFIMQLSDVGHMIQQWPIYMKWNERLFHEYLKYYNANNVERSKKVTKRRGSGIGTVSSSSEAVEQSTLKHPSVYWYEMELRYMQQYVLPLTGKICAEFMGIFSCNKNMMDGTGAMCPLKNQKCSKEYYIAINQLLNEWILRGPSIVDEMVSKFTTQAPQRQQQHQSIQNTSNSSIEDSTTLMNVSSILVLPQLPHEERNLINENSQTQNSLDIWMNSSIQPIEQHQQHQISVSNSDNKTNPAMVTDLGGKVSNESSHSTNNMRNPPKSQARIPSPPLRTSKSHSSASSHNPFTFL